MRILREQASQELAGLAAELQPDVPARAVVVAGQPAEMIIDQAYAHQIDLIVMATHGYSGVRRWALGSIADKVLHATTTPLILVRVGKNDDAAQ